MQQITAPRVADVFVMQPEQMNRSRNGRGLSIDGRESALLAARRHEIKSSAQLLRLQGIERVPTPEYGKPKGSRVL